MRVLTGSFHPHLEQALGEAIGRVKAADPLAPIALVVPSSSLAAHVRRVLVAEQRRALLNVHVQTFHQLALRLYAESRATPGPSVPFSGIEVRPEFFFEQLVGRLVRQDLGSLQPLCSAAAGPGTWTVLWRTIRDLQEAGVDPAVALRAIDEGVFAPEESAELRALFLLHAAFAEGCRALGVGLLDDLAAAAVPVVPSSAFVKGLAGVCYYGFYDLTQVQLSLLEAIAAQAPVTLFFPLEARPAYAFARRFFERCIVPLSPAAGRSAPVPAKEDRSAVEREIPARTIISAVGPEEELVAAARQILILVETHGYRFDQIGLVARSLEPYQGLLRLVFEDHRIPFAASAGTPLLHDPDVKVLLALASLPVLDFSREAVLDVVTAPAYARDSAGGGRGEARPDQWRLAARALGVIRGERDWDKLARADEVEVLGSDADGDEAVEASSVGQQELVRLWTAVRRLIDDLRALPAEGGYAELTEAFLAVASRHLRIPGVAPERREEEEADPRARAVGMGIRAGLEAVRQLEALGEPASYDAWFLTFTRALERISVPLGPAPGEDSAVRVHDVMEARGLSFEALLVLGLNEKVFPRYIHEDPFLPDRHRRALDETLGYKIDEKLGGYDEEALLFALLESAARRRLFLIYQRADEEGRPVAPSPYVAELLHAGAPEVRLPRRLTEREASPFGALLLVSTSEAILRAVLNGDDPAPLLEFCGRDASLLHRGRRALASLERHASRVGPRDGLTGPLDAHWERLRTRGLAPTALEQYATCPHRYFAARVLRLESVRQDVPEELPPHAWGTLIHAVLRACYQALIDRGWPERTLDDEVMRDVIEEVSSPIYDEYARHHGTGHALLWRLARERIGEVALGTARADRDDFLRTGFRPVAFELEASGTLEGILGDPGGGLLVRGRLDRVDRRTAPPGVRIVDYKYKQSRALGAREKDLVTNALRGRNLQPPLYAVMETGLTGSAPGEATATRAERIEVLFLAPRSPRLVERAAFHATAPQEGARRLIETTVRALVDGLRAGRFFIMPDGYCAHCDYAAMCRRAHGPTWLRAYVAAPARAMRLLRRQKAADAPGHDS